MSYLSHLISVIKHLLSLFCLKGNRTLLLDFFKSVINEHYLAHTRPPPLLQHPLFIVMFIWWEWTQCELATGKLGGWQVLRCWQMSADFYIPPKFQELPFRPKKLKITSLDICRCCWPTVEKRKSSYGHAVAYLSMGPAIQSLSHTCLHSVNPSWIPCVHTWLTGLIKKTSPLFILPRLRCL